jgi:hypothetical protein
MSGIGAVNALSVDVTLPEAGQWIAYVVLDSGDAPTGKVTLTVGDLQLRGTVPPLRAGPDYNGKPSLVVEGGLGWSTLAKGSGEPIEQPKDATIGNYYEFVSSRSGAKLRYADALNDLQAAGVISTWRVDPDGVTRFTARKSVAVTSRATGTVRIAKHGLTRYGVDAPASFLPGNTIDGKPLGRVRIVENAKTLHVEAYDVSGVPSLQETIRRMVAHEVQEQLRTLVVQSVGADGRIDLTPPADAQHIPEMRRVEQWGSGGIKVFPKAGSQVAVAFRDERATRPAVVGFDTATPDKMTIDATGKVIIQGGTSGIAAGAARENDAVEVMVGPASIIGQVTVPPGSPALPSGGPLPFTGFAMWTPNVWPGRIVGHSLKTDIG